MIYLIDDRKHRQEEGGWSSEKFSAYTEYIKPIYIYEELSNLSNEIFSSGNIVLFHESFIDKTSRAHDSLIKDFEIKLKNEVKKDDNFKLVYFSGSKKFRNLKDEIGYLPVEIVYQNLDVFIDKIKGGIIDLKHLLYGNNHQIEENLYNQLRLKNETIEDFQISDAISANFVAKTLDDEIDDPFTNADNEIIFGDEISDEYLNEIIIEWFSENEYDNLFIPLCFGPSLSDYNGLRLATHIRCTTTKNQLKPIFIYSFVDYSFLIENEYFDVLKTKNVFLIEYSKSAFKDALDMNISPLTIEENPKQIRKINLNVPKDIGDNHSIANQWAIYRWSQTINAYDENIDKIIDLQNSNLYFKYLKSIYPISNLNKLDPKHLKINYSDQPKVLYIDDEAEKGWYEIFCKILDDENNLFFRHLDDEFKGKSKDKIIDISLKKIISEDIDLVILDFRLHKDDIKNRNIEEVTGYQILKRIKEYNKGIQVIIFSATNKIWNLQALQEAGADGFIVKEGPENSLDSEFTKHSILNIIKSLEICLSMIFLKDISKIITQIKSHIYTVSNNCDEKEFEKLSKLKFKNEIFIQLDIIYDCLKKSSLDISTEIKDESSYLNLSFISIFKIIELINDHYTVESGTMLKSSSIIIQNYDQNSNTFSKILNQYPTTRDKILTILKFELNDNPILYVNKLNQFIKFRNNIIHPKTLKDYKKTTKKENLDFLTVLKSIIINVK
jgi:CheY-like chemotaxis protein